MQRFLLLVCLIAIVGSGCSRGSETASKETASASASGETILFEGLGSHARPITTQSPEAQTFFNQGLAFLYAFNHDEAIRSFTHAASLDTGAAMPYWGISVANGPHINNPFVDSTHAAAAWTAYTEAQARAAGSSEVERALIQAVGTRYASPAPADRKPLDEAYAAAMAEVWRAYPEDADVGALYAEAMMDLRPWRLWTHDGRAEPGTETILETLEQVMAQAPMHPLANHLYIHAVEASPHPEKANASADRLRNLNPGLGHMVHMPSHIDVRTGRWAEAQTQNELAIEADRKYRELSPRQGFYRIYMAHNQHMLTHAAMMQGESALALASIHQMVANIPPEFVKESAAFVDGFMALPLEIEMRFGLWDSVLAAPDFPEYLPLARAMRAFARGASYAAKGMLPEANAEQAAFLERKAAVPAESFMGNNSAADLLRVAEHMLAGEILVRAGDIERGLSELSRAVEAEDALVYDEPPDWILPVRHALGAALLVAGREKEAEAVYREDLSRLPRNGWSLYGLSRSLEIQKKNAEAATVKAEFDKVWGRADLKLTSSCFCQPAT